MDATESMTGNARIDDGSDEHIDSSKFAERAFLNDICNNTKIDKDSLQAALRDNESAKSFTFSRT